MGLCPDCAEPTETFELPLVFLKEYPDLEDLKNTQTRQITLAIYYHNRMVQSLFESLLQGRLIRGLTDTYVASVLDLIETSLSRLGSTCEVFLLARFITHETALFNDSRRQWFDQKLYLAACKRQDRPTSHNRYN